MLVHVVDFWYVKRKLEFNISAFLPAGQQWGFAEYTVSEV